MRILIDDPNHNQPRTFEELGPFMQTLNNWTQNELQQNPNNHGNINHASGLIFDCYINYYPNLDLSGLGLRSIPIGLITPMDSLVSLNVDRDEIEGLNQLIESNSRISDLINNLDHRRNLIAIPTLPPQILNPIAIRTPPRQILNLIEFVQTLINLSDFNDDEKNSTDIQSIGISRETSLTSNSKILSQKLGEIF
jgi:hypothetical protein